MLSDRRQRVLAALIEEYVSHALPVGSRTLVEKHHLGVSPATVRNELSVLEDDGLIAQPHTSAGRIPTDYGYRSFVDDLLAQQDMDYLDEIHADAVRQMRESATELDQLFEQTSAALARLTECLSIVVPPSALFIHVKQVSFVSLSPRRALIVAVAENGHVFNRQVEFAEDVKDADLEAAQKLVSSLVVGKKVSEVGDIKTEDNASIASSPLAAVMIEELFACLKQGESAHSQGLTTLMQQPEFVHSHALIPVLQVLEDDTVLMQIVSGTEGFLDTMVRIGHENANENLQGVSVVASRFGHGDSEGIVAVIGPTRMDYAQVIGAVHMARGALQDL